MDSRTLLIDDLPNFAGSMRALELRRIVEAGIVWDLRMQFRGVD